MPPVTTTVESERGSGSAPAAVVAPDQAARELVALGVALPMSLPAPTALARASEVMVVLAAVIRGLTGLPAKVSPLRMQQSPSSTPVAKA